MVVVAKPFLLSVLLASQSFLALCEQESINTLLELQRRAIAQGTLDGKLFGRATDRTIMGLGRRDPDLLD